MSNYDLNWHINFDHNFLPTIILLVKYFFVIFAYTLNKNKLDVALTVVNLLVFRYVMANQIICRFNNSLNTADILIKQIF